MFLINLNQIPEIDNIINQPSNIVFGSSNINTIFIKKNILSNNYPKSAIIDNNKVIGIICSCHIDDSNSFNTVIILQEKYIANIDLKDLMCQYCTTHNQTILRITNSRDFIVKYNLYNNFHGYKLNTNNKLDYYFNNLIYKIHDIKMKNIR